MRKIFMLCAVAVSVVTAADAQIGFPARVVAGDPESSLLVPQKEGCELVYVNTDAAPEKVAASQVAKVTDAPMDPPFTCDFNNATDMDLFTIIDANRDGKTWERNNQGFAAVMYNTYQSANDYIVSPGLNLKAGYIYTFSTAARPYQSQYPEKLELRVGQSPTAEGLSTCVLPATTLTEEKWIDQSADFTAPADGVYYFAVRGVSDADRYALLINDFKVSAGVNGMVPGRPVLEAVRNSDGEPKATINVTVPEITANGQELKSVTSVSIYRDEVLIHTFTDVAVGKTYTYIDNEPSVAMHTYTAQCVNAEGAGMMASSSCFTGVYLAVWPEKVTPTVGENEGQVVLDWTPCLTDQLGNPLRADQVTYTIYRIHEGNVTKHAEGVAQPHFVDQVCGENDYQREVQYTVMSNTSYGQSAGTGSGLFYAGAPYGLPYSESLANGQISSLMFTRGLANYAASWDIAKIGSYDLPYPEQGSDNDGGFLYHRAYNVDEMACVGTAKLHIPADAVTATLKFDTYLNGTESTPNNNKLEVKAIVGGKETSVGTYTQNGIPGWTTCDADVTSFAGKTIQLSWTNTVKTHVITAVDNIRVTCETRQTTSVDDIEANDESDAEYFSLQGVKVCKPTAPGVYICRKGNVATKIMIR